MVGLWMVILRHTQSSRVEMYGGTMITYDTYKMINEELVWHNLRLVVRRSFVNLVDSTQGTVSFIYFAN